MSIYVKNDILMQQITIGTKNQIVIPKEVRKKITGLKPGRVVSVYPLNKNTVVIKVSEKNWLDNGYGAMKTAWKGNKVAKRIDEMRDEWYEK